MDWEKIQERLLRPAHPAVVVLAGVAILAGLYTAPRWLEATTGEERLFQQTMSHVLDQAASAREHFVSLDTLKTMDLEQLKAGISGHAQSEKSLFESGLSLQEERRLLEK